MNIYATTKELKNKRFRINSQNIQQATGIQVTYISKIKIQKEAFLAKYDCFFADLCVHYEPLLGWKCTYVCHNLRTEKEGM